MEAEPDNWDVVAQQVRRAVASLDARDFRSASDEFADAFRKADREQHEWTALAFAGRLAALVGMGHYETAAKRWAEAPEFVISECRQKGVGIALRLPDEDLVKFMRLTSIVVHEHAWAVMNLGADLGAAGRIVASRGVLKLLVSHLHRTGDRENRHRAEAQLGHTEALAGNSSAALDLWATAFAAGSTNRKLALWYTRALFDGKEYARCAEVCLEALGRIDRQPARRSLESRYARAVARAAVGRPAAT